jgi:hypothetical protein
MPTRICATCGRLWSSTVRRSFGERCPECEAKAGETTQRLAAGAFAPRPVGPRAPASSSRAREGEGAARAERSGGPFAGWSDPSDGR